LLRAQRMKKLDRAEAPQILSTHPSHAQRIDKMRAWIPEALQQYQEAGCRDVMQSFWSLRG